MGNLFKPAENQSAYLKAGWQGFQGSGKTFTMAQVARGLWKKYGLKKPVFFLDTETGSDFLIPDFKKDGVPLMVSKSSSFVDLAEAIRVAERDASILLIDSLTHFWRTLTKSWLESKGKEQLGMRGIMVCKEKWADGFTLPFVNANVHIMFTGRAGYEFDDNGEGGIVKVGTKMKVEGETAFEPSLLVEMVSVQTGDLKKGTKAITNKAVVLKDRFNVINGKVFDEPSFTDFLPHIELLNLGGAHVGVEPGSDSKQIFAGDANDWGTRKQERDILVAEMKGMLDRHMPGAAGDQKKARLDFVYRHLKVNSWEMAQELPNEVLRSRIKDMARELEDAPALKSLEKSLAQETGPATKTKAKQEAKV